MKKRREKVNESLAEVSGAVEIDIETLVKIETGELLPSEDILALLISYFDINIPEANKLLNWAGYDFAKTSQEPQFDEQITKQIFAVIPIDNRVIYTDQTDVQVSDNGIVLNFSQKNLNNQPSSISRVGLSREHARRLIKLLEHSLKPPTLKQKLLPKPKNQKSKQ